MARQAILTATTPEAPPRAQPELTLGALLRRAAGLRGDALAVAEAPDTATWYHRGPRELSVGALAEQAETIGTAMLALGLSPGDRIIVQLPNIADLGAAILGLASAGLVPCPVPMSFATEALQAATAAVGARAIITTAQFGRQRPAEAAVAVAAALLDVRFLCGFGSDLPDGVTPLDGWRPAPSAMRETSADAISLVTFARHGDRLLPIARSHRQLMAEALALAVAAKCDQRTVLVSTLPASSALGVAANLVLPLLTGSRLHLHGPFSSRVLIAQLAAVPGAMLLVPAALTAALADLAGELPARLGTPLLAHRWPNAGTAAPAPFDVVDLHAFGESALVALPRDAGRDLAPLPARATHPAAAVLGMEGAMLEAGLDASGQLLLSGAGVATLFDSAPAPVRQHDTGIAGRRLPDGAIAFG